MLVLGEGWDLMYKYQSEKEINQRVFPFIFQLSLDIMEICPNLTMTCTLYQMFNRKLPTDKVRCFS